MDVTNPGLVNVANQSYGNPDPNGGSSLILPPVLEVTPPLPSPDTGAISEIVPTPTNVIITEAPPAFPVNSSVAPNTNEVYVDDQIIGQGTWEYVDPLNPALGKRFVPPEDIIVVGPAESFRIRESEETLVEYQCLQVYDADKFGVLPTPVADADTLRYMIVVGPPFGYGEPALPLTAYPVSMLGRQIVFESSASPPPNNEGASRPITGLGWFYDSPQYVQYIVINKIEPLDDRNPELELPTVGDTFLIETERQGSEVVRTTDPAPANVYILPPPPAFLPNPDQANQDQGNVFITSGPQPGQPVLTSGVNVPRAENFNVIDQAVPVGLPKNVNVP